LQALPDADAGQRLAGRSEVNLRDDVAQPQLERIDAEVLGDGLHVLLE
jgi:hypothetical protein